MKFFNPLTPEAERDLALQLIDLGYKALAMKLHPDRGGSHDAMARLNKARERLRGPYLPPKKGKRR